MKKVTLLGKNGFIGHSVLNHLQKKYDCQEEGNATDVLVNCAGFAIMHEARENPQKMRDAENITFDRICKTPFQHLIHISTIYIEASPSDNYSVIKKELEDRILGNFKNVTILRLASVLGRGLKKNVIFDLSHDFPLWVTPDSIYNYISSEETARIIEHLIENPIYDIINVGAADSVKVSDVAFSLEKSPMYGNKRDIVLMNVSKLQTFYKVKTSMEYVKEYWRNYVLDQSI